MMVHESPAWRASSTAWRRRLSASSTCLLAATIFLKFCASRAWCVVTSSSSSPVSVSVAYVMFLPQKVVELCSESVSVNDSVGRWGWDCDEFEQCAVGGGPDQEYAVLSVVFVFDYPYGVFPRVCDVSMCDAVLVGAGKNFHTVNCKLTAWGCQSLLAWCAGVGKTKNPAISTKQRGVCGGWGIRTPEGLHPTRFPSVRHRPLGESSKALHRFDHTADQYVQQHRSISD